MGWLLGDLRLPAAAPAGYEVRPFPTIRRAYVDVLRQGHRHHTIHGLVEFDVSRARTALRAREARGEPLSFTAFVVAAVATAVDEDRMLHAHRWGRRKLVLFDDVDVNLQLEQVLSDGIRIVQSRIVRAANRKTAEDISAEIRAAQRGTDDDRRRYRGTLWFVRLPAVVRAPLWQLMMSRPWWTKRFGGTIAVSAIGMFGDGSGWGIPISPAPSWSPSAASVDGLWSSMGSCRSASTSVSPSASITTSSTALRLRGSWLGSGSSSNTHMDWSTWIVPAIPRPRETVLTAWRLGSPHTHHPARCWRRATSQAP